MKYIRRAVKKDACRIAEIIVTNYRVNFYPFFHNDAYYFSELNVMDVASEYMMNEEILASTYVWDENGIVKGVIRIHGEEIQKLFVEPQFQGQHIGEALLNYAVEQCGASWLWALAYNTRGIAFYERHGFHLTGEKIIEDEWVPLVKLRRNQQKIT